MPIPFRTFADLTETLAEVTWLWEDWIPRGHLTLVAGMPEVGKSNLCLDIAARVLLEQPWPDGQPAPKNTPVVWIDTESSIQITHERATRWGLPLDKLILPALGDFETIAIDRPADIEVLKQIITDCRPGLVVMDSLRGGYRGDLNDSRIMGHLQKLAAIAKSWDIPILCVGQLRKRRETDVAEEVTLEQVSGSFTIAYQCRSVIALNRPKMGEVVKVASIKNNFGPKPEPLGFVVTDEQLYWRTAPTSIADIKARDRAVLWLRELLATGPKPAKEIYEVAEAQGISLRTLKRAKKLLGCHSYLQRSGDERAWFWST